MRLHLSALAAVLLTTAATAQQPGVPAPEAAAAAPTADPQGPPPPADPRVNQLIIYGDDPCPPSTDDEIIVCARLPEGDRFRIPPDLRENPEAPENQSWTTRAVELSYVGRSGIGSCTPAGSGGSIGCFNQLLDQARAERRAAGDVDWNRMIEEAREARMRRIGEAEAEEAAEENAPD